MSQKAAKIAKNKHGVKVMGLKNDSPSPTPISTSSVTVDPQEILDVQPVQHESPKSAKPDVPKKKFKSRYSTRYRHSMKGKGSLSSTSPIDIPDEDDVDEVITKVVDSISKETAAEIESPDVRPNVATSGTSENPISPTPIAVVVDEPIVEEPESEDEESADQDSEEETEEEKSDPSKDDEVLNQTIVQEPAASQPNDSDFEESTDEDENVQAPTPENVVSGDNSDDIPITKSVPESVAARLKTKNEGSAKKDMASASTPVSYKSRQVSFTPMKKSDKKKKTVDKKKSVEKKEICYKEKTCGSFFLGPKCQTRCH